MKRRDRIVWRTADQTDESADTGGSTTNEPAGTCPPGWELPASIMAPVLLFPGPGDPDRRQRQGHRRRDRAGGRRDTGVLRRDRHAEQVLFRGCAEWVRTERSRKRNEARSGTGRTRGGGDAAAVRGAGRRFMLGKSLPKTGRSSPPADSLP